MKQFISSKSFICIHQKAHPCLLVWRPKCHSHCKLLGTQTREKRELYAHASWFLFSFYPVILLLPGCPPFFFFLLFFKNTFHSLYSSWSWLVHLSPPSAFHNQKFCFYTFCSSFELYVLPPFTVRFFLTMLLLS